MIFCFTADKNGSKSDACQGVCAFSGAPVISSLSKHSSDDGKYKVLTCEAEGFPKPAVTWNINGTLVRASTFLKLVAIQNYTLPVLPFQTKHCWSTVYCPVVCKSLCDIRLLFSLQLSMTGRQNLL